jgi:hypothetical protein
MAVSLRKGEQGNQPVTGIPANRGQTMPRPHAFSSPDGTLTPSTVGSRRKKRYREKGSRQVGRSAVSTDQSITRQLPGVKQADHAAISALFARCYGRVIRIAQRMLRGKPQRGFDEEDLAISAFREFLDRAAKREFRQLENREDVWQILALLVVDKVRDRLRGERAKKRGRACSRRCA